MKPIEKFIEGMKSADNSAYTLKQLITKLSLITKDIATDTETAPKVIKLGSSTDVTSVFDQVKVGDMINHDGTRLYIVTIVDLETICLFVFNYDTDSLCYWVYEKDGDNWIFNEDGSFDINKSSLGGGTKLYKHTLEITNDTDIYDNLIVISTRSTAYSDKSQFTDIVSVMSNSQYDGIVNINPSYGMYACSDMGNSWLSWGIKIEISDTVTEL